MALVGVHALDLQSVDYPKVLQEYHPLFKDFNSEDAAVRKAARARLGLVDETLASMLDGLKSERAAVSSVGCIGLGSVFVHEFGVFTKCIIIVRISFCVKACTALLYCVLLLF